MKFGGLEPQRYEDIKEIVAPEIGGLSNTPKLSPMEEGHEQPDSPEDSSRET